ncbi:MAG: hypothetical protein DRQ60_09835 [Gammaproteobacteria bacterium]|nr:MAG: hypothetical protein DRQ60_09835 [Gammaproteobacteria bacterium]
MGMNVDRDFIINLKLTNAGLHVHELLEEDKREVYRKYNECGGLGMYSSRDTHFVMDADKVIFVGNKDELLGFVNSNF